MSGLGIAKAHGLKTCLDDTGLAITRELYKAIDSLSTAGVRSFVKISVSRHRYNLVGNSVNHLLGLNWPMAERMPERNHPIAHSLSEPSS